MSDTKPKKAGAKKQSKALGIAASNGSHDGEWEVWISVRLTTYGNRPQMLESAENAIKTLAVTRGAEVRGVLPGGQEVTYDQRGRRLPVEP